MKTTRPDSVWVDTPSQEVSPLGHPLRGVATDWLPAPSLELLARERLVAVLFALAVLHVVVALAHVADPVVWTFQTPRSWLPYGRGFGSSAFIVAFATAVFLLVSRILLPRLPLRWGQPLAALTATLVTVNALGTFELGVSAEKTAAVMLAAIMAGALLFCPRFLLLVLAVAVGGWLGIARQAGFSPSWVFYGVCLAGSCGAGFALQRLQVQSIRLMLRGAPTPLECKPEPAPPTAAVSPAEEDERFRRWYEATFEGIAIHEKGVILEANKALAALLQADAAGLPRQNLLDWFTRASRDIIEESILLGNFRPFEAVARRADKTEVHLELFTKRIPYHGREVMVTAFRDITERRRAAAAAEADQLRLQQQYRRQHALADISLTSGKIEDAALVLDSVVKAAAEVLPARGGAAVIVIEDGIVALAASHLPERAREIGFDPAAQLTRAAEWIAEQRKTFISSNVAHDDPFAVSEPVEFISAYAGVPLLDGDRVAGVLFTFETELERHFTPDDRDFLDALATRAALVLARARLCGELGQANARLRQQSLQLQAQNEALASAKTRAEEASAAKTEFLAKVSHELRTPLNGVMGMTDYLLTTDLNSEQHESAETIRVSADVLLHNINRVLDFSRLESGLHAAQREHFSMTELVRSLVTAAARRISANVTVSGSVAANFPSVVNGDLVTLRRSMAELMDNAVKFTTDGEIVISVLAQDQTAECITAVLCVRDTGDGMDAAARHRLFEAFRQADGSDSRAHQGFGLGLASTRRLVNLMGGDITVASQPGQGSAFTVTVPLEIPSRTPAPA